MPDPIKLPPGATLVSDPQASSLKLPPGATLVSGPKLAPEQQRAFDEGYSEQSSEGQAAARALIPDFAEIGKQIWAQINPGEGVVGMAQATSHPIDTLKNDASAREAIYKKAEEAFKQGKHGEGAAHLVYSMLPFFGPGLDEAGTDFNEGRFSSGFGKSAGMGLAVAAPEKVGGMKIPAKVKAVAGDLSERMYQSALKPSLASNSAADIKSMVNTGLENSIPVSEAGAQRIHELVTNLDSRVKAQIASNPHAPINKFKVTKRLGETADKFRTQVAPNEDLAAISRTGEQFAENEPAAIPASRAQELKRGTYQRQSARAYGETGSATVEAEKALARGLKEELEAQFPQIKTLNAQEGKLLNLGGELERAIKRGGNHNLISLNTPVTAAAGGVAGLVLHGGESAAPAAVAAVVLRTALEDPAIKSKLAIAISKASRGKVGYGAAKLRVAGYLDALGNAVDGESNSSPDKSQQ